MCWRFIQANYSILVIQASPVETILECRVQYKGIVVPKLSFILSLLAYQTIYERLFNFYIDSAGDIKNV